MQFVTQDKVIPVTSKFTNSVYCAEMDQGEASFRAPVDSARYDAFLSALNLSRSDLADRLPLQVVSTGLPYLIVPLRTNLDRASIRGREFESLLASVGAKFVYVLDVANMEARTWDNDGRVEDIATGSAAGPAAAYLVQHKLANTGETIVLRQGRFVGRPSELLATVRGVSALSVSVSGQVCFVGSGVLELPSASLQPTAFGGR
jgi:PhzF family phenazine biosynthesis protein